MPATPATPQLLPRVTPKKPFGRTLPPPEEVRPEKLFRSRDLLRTALAVFIVVGISQIQLLFPVVAKMRPALVAIAITAVIAYLNPSLLASGSVLRTWQGKTFAALFVVGCLSIPTGISIGNSGLFLINSFWKTMLFAFLIIAATRRTKDLYTLCWAFLIACGILAYIALYTAPLVNYGDYSRLSNLHSYDANDVACVMVAGVGMALLLLRTSGTWRGRVVSFVVLLALCAAIARTGSRGGLLGLVAVGVGVLLFDKGSGPVLRVVQIAVGIAVLNARAPMGYWDQMRTILEPKSDYNYTSVEGRREVARRGVGYMREYPIFGVGLNNFAKAECTISERAQTRLPGTPIKCSAPHNSYVQAGAETGVTGLLLWTALIIGGILQPLRARRRMPAFWRHGDAEERFLYSAAGLLPASMLGFAVCVFFLTFAWLDVPFLLFGLSAAFELSVHAKLRENILHPPPVVPARKGAPGWRTELQPAPR